MALPLYQLLEHGSPRKRVPSCREGKRYQLLRIIDPDLFDNDGVASWERSSKRGQDTVLEMLVDSETNQGNP